MFWSQLYLSESLVRFSDFDFLLYILLANDIYFVERRPIEYSSAECRRHEDEFVYSGGGYIFSLFDRPTNHVQKFNAYLEEYFVSNNTITLQQWNEALPTKAERQEMKNVRRIFDSLNGKNHSFSTIKVHRFLAHYLFIQPIHLR